MFADRALVDAKMVGYLPLGWGLHLLSHEILDEFQDRCLPWSQSFHASLLIDG